MLCFITLKMHGTVVQHLENQVTHNKKVRHAKASNMINNAHVLAKNQAILLPLINGIPRASYLKSGKGDLINTDGGYPVSPLSRLKGSTVTKIKLATTLEQFHKPLLGSSVLPLNKEENEA